MKSPLRKNMGKKNCELTPELRKEIIRIFLEMEQSEVSKIFNNEDFGHWAITVERPLRLRVFPQRKIPSGVLKGPEADAYADAIAALPTSIALDDWKAFAKATKLKAALLKKVRPYITEKDPTAKAIDGEADTNLRETEQVPFNYEGGIEAYLANEVHPFAPDAWFDMKSIKIGYELSFIKYFYRAPEMRTMQEIMSDLEMLESETNGRLSEVIGGLSI